VTEINHLIDPEQDKVRVTVPRGVTGNCKVWLKVDGVEVEVGNFWVVDRMVIEPTSVTRQVGESYEAKAHLETFSLHATPVLNYPMLTWTSAATATAFVTTGGTVYAYRPGRTRITARSGDLSTSFDLITTDRHSTASFDVTVPDLNSGTVEVPLEIPAYSGDETGTVTH
jgi:hypothetical protein